MGEEILFENWKTDKLQSLKYNRAICMLASGYSCKQVASYLGVTERSIQKWFKESKFNQSLRYAIGICFHEALCNASQYCNTAVNTLIEISQDKEAPYKYRLEAIRLLFSFAHQAGIDVIPDKNPNENQDKVNEQLLLLNQFTTAQSLISEQRQFSLPAQNTKNLEENKKLWKQLFSDEPFPDNESLKIAFEKEH